MTDTCAACGGSGWICEEHPERPHAHEGCNDSGVPCPACNAAKPPRPPTQDWSSFVDALAIHAPSTRAPELLCEFTRASDGAAMSCWLKFVSESYGWEARILEGADLFASHGAFVTRAQAVHWAEHERLAMEKGGV